MRKHGVSRLFLFFVVMLASCATTSAPLPQETIIEEGMVLIPRGWFSMGYDEGEFNERPIHEVFLEPYLIDRYEVSASEFALFLNEKGNPDNRFFFHDEYATVIGVKNINGRDVEAENEPDTYIPRKGFERYPANNVSWYGADAYCRWKEKRLPSEAEWEKAARGVDLRIYPWGNVQPDNTKARFNQTWDMHGLNVLLPVNSLPEGKSVYGVFNMSGNVWEWINDWFRLNYCDFCDPGGDEYITTASGLLGKDINDIRKMYEADPDAPPRRNPTGPDVGRFKVLRGGSWHEISEVKIRSTFRYWLDPLERDWSTGFRCVRDVYMGSDENRTS
jgi:formylglycine-generating enzyme required for sulfatase activity